MKYQNFIMRILCLLLILAAVVGYNSMQKKDTQAQESQEITALTKRVEKLEEQNTEILSALEEAAKNQEAAIAQAQRDAKDKDDAAKEDAEEADAADTEESDDSENVYKDGTYTGSAQGFGGAITVQVTLANDEITDIQVTSAPGEDSAYLSQGEGVISSIISAQSTDVDTVSGATYSSRGIMNAVNAGVSVCLCSALNDENCRTARIKVLQNLQHFVIKSLYISISDFQFNQAGSYGALQFW